MWSFYGWQKQLFLVTLTIYGHGSGTHGAGAGGGLQAGQQLPPLKSVLHGVGGGLSILLLLFLLFLPLLPKGAHQNQRLAAESGERGDSCSFAFKGTSEKSLLALLCSMRSKTLPSCASLPLFLKRSWRSLVIITVGKSHLMTWGAILQCWMHNLGSRAGLRGGHACPGSSASCRHVVFHKKLMFTSQSQLKFKLAGDAMFTMHSISLFCWVCERGWALCSTAVFQASGKYFSGLYCGAGWQVHNRACWLAWERIAFLRMEGKEEANPNLQNKLFQCKWD